MAQTLLPAVCHSMSPTESPKPRFSSTAKYWVVPAAACTGDAVARLEATGVAVRVVIEAESDPDDAANRSGAVWKQEPAAGEPAAGTVTKVLKSKGESAEVGEVIGPKGKVHESGPQFTAVTMTREVQPMRGATPYVTAGNWPILIIGWVVLGIFWVRSRAAL